MVADTVIGSWRELGREQIGSWRELGREQIGSWRFLSLLALKVSVVLADITFSGKRIPAVLTNTTSLTICPWLLSAGSPSL